MSTRTPSPAPLPGGARPASPIADRPDRAEAWDRRGQILAAALRVVRVTGMGGVRMEAIAAEARVSKGTLYNYFDSKESLLLEMVVDRFRAGSEIVEEAMGQPADPAAALAGLVEGLGRLVDRQAADYPLLFQAWSVVAHAPERSEELFGPLRELFRAWTDATRNLLADGVASGAFRPELDVQAVAGATTALVAGLLFRATFDPEEAHGEALRRSLHAMVGDLVEPVRADRHRPFEGDSR